MGFFKRVSIAIGTSLVLCLFATQDADGGGNGCPTGMARVEMERGGQTHAFCIDRWEASVVEVEGRTERAHSPYEGVENLHVRAVTRPGVMPQAYISRDQADTACHESHKRLCVDDEWTAACEGRNPTTFPYGNDRRDGYCNDTGRAPIAVVHPELGNDAYASFSAMNDPRLNQVPGTLSRTGSHPHCRSSYGPFDMVGNVHEWVDDHAGTFRGGYYLDTHLNGDGCHYRTEAHDAQYHDYSTGFRCCSDPRGR